jgi:hypothetical protein
MRCRIPGCDHWVRARFRRAQSDRQKPANAFCRPRSGGAEVMPPQGHGIGWCDTVATKRRPGRHARGLTAGALGARRWLLRGISFGPFCCQRDPSIRFDGAACVRRGGDWIKTSGFDDVDRMAADDASIPMFFSHCREIQPCSRTMPV